MGFIVERVDQTDCPRCGQSVEVAGAKPFSKITCPSCSARMAVPARAGTMLITRLLGQGTSSLVYEARDRVLDRTVALKVMKDAAAAESETGGGIDEARALLMIDHPNIVKVYAIDTRRGQPCIIMETLPGGSLKERIADGRTLDEHEALSIAIEVSRGLQEAHRRGILHLDVKPGNIMFDAAGHAKILDFGFAGIDLDDEANEVIGTPYYVSPELVRMETPDPRADIYSLGATLFHVLTGEPPFRDESIKTLILARVRGPAPDIRTLKPGLSEPTATLVMRMLERNPDDRYADYEQLIAHLEHARDPSKPPPKEPTPEVRAVYPKPRKRRIQTAPEAKQAACEWMRYLGYPDAEMIVASAADRIDVRAEGGVARVDIHRKPVGRSEVLQLCDTADARKCKALFFAMAGYTSDAAALADKRNAALFTLNRAGRAFAANSPSRRTLETVGHRE